MNTVKFILNIAGGADILKNNTALQSMEDAALNSVLGDIEAQFFQTFGVEGKFQVADFTTDRSSAKIQAADARTGAVLKANPRWLDQFTDNMKI